VVVSFTVFFVPAVAAAYLLRAQLCRRGKPLPVHRVDGLLRASAVGSLLVGVTVLVDWLALAARAHRTDWGGPTLGLVVALTVLAALVLLSWRYVDRARRLVAAEVELAGPGDDMDWLADLQRLPAAAAGLAGPATWRATVSRLARAAQPTVDRLAERVVRPHPVATAACLSWGLGLVVATGLAVREEGFGPLLPIGALVFGGGTFGALLALNPYLRLVRRRRRPAGALAVAGCAAGLALPVALGLRDTVWRALGLGPAITNAGSLACLLLGASLLAGVVAGVAAGVVAGVLRRAARR
jgi:hypothetical protein